MQIDESMLALCRALIEKKVGWADSANWTSSDFETLSELIFADTSVALSASTLKRVWGRVRYTSTPQIATLNALARFAGHEDFRSFEAAQRRKNDIETNTTVSKPESVGTPISSKFRVEDLVSKNRIFTIGLAAGIAISLLLAFSLTISQKKDGNDEFLSFTFSSRPVSEGLPNSVVFTFDVAAATTDSLFIQQSWDATKRISIKKDQKQASSIYYYPGFYKAKLIVGDSAVRQHDLLIKTKGWLPLVEQSPVPVYFTQKEAIRDGELNLTSEMLKSRNVSLQPTVPSVSYYYVQDMGALSSENFTLETKLKNTYSTGSGACQNTQLIILCENTVMVIPLAIPGCTSAINAMFADKLLKGTETDLSAFGVNFEDYVKLRLEVKNKSVQVLINDHSALKTDFKSDAGKVIGFVYRFAGTGAVDYLHVNSVDGKEILSEDF